MTKNEISYAAGLFRAACSGSKLTEPDRAALRAILDRMDEAERAGSIAAIIKIMLG